MAAVDLVLDGETRLPHPIDARSFGCHTAVLAQSGSGKSFLVGRLIEELLVKTRAKVVVLDVNSDFVRLPETDRDVWSNPVLQPWFFPEESSEGFTSEWARVRPLVLSNRNLPATDIHPLRISWGGLGDAERADVMGIDPTAEPELYWSLVLAGEVARARWNEDVEPEYDFQHFRAVADEVCDFLLGSDGPEDISERPLASSLRSSGPGLPLRFRALVYALEVFDIWRSVGEGERDVADVLLSENDVSSATVIDLLSVGTDAERLALTTRALSALWKKAREAYGTSLRDIDEPDHRVPTFVVIDEAHNLVPVERSSAAAERLAGDVLRIAAEGRKFGLYLVVITQRPRKLDPSILSECDALLLMRMTNGSDVGEISNVFGFLEGVLPGAVKNLGVGDVVLQGSLGQTGTVWHAAPRRTKQGGRSLDSAYWTAPDPESS